MKLSAIPDEDKNVHIPLTLKSSVVSDINTYAKFYKKETGKDISVSALVQQMLIDFFQEDKTFKRFKDTLAADSQAAQPSNQQFSSN